MTVTLLPDPETFTSQAKEEFHFDLGCRFPYSTLYGFLVVDLFWSIWSIDCRTHPPTVSKIKLNIVHKENQVSFFKGVDLTEKYYVRHGKKNTIVMFHGTLSGGGIEAYDVTSGEKVWELLRMPGGNQNISVASVTSDHRGHVFLYDSNSGKILILLTSSGEFLDSLLAAGQEGIGAVKLISWCDTQNALAVVHSRDQSLHISFIEVKL